MTTGPSARPLGSAAQLRPVRGDDAEELFSLVDANRARLREWLEPENVEVEY